MITVNINKAKAIALANGKEVVRALAVAGLILSTAPACTSSAGL
jgi:hypothetical protein